VDSEQLSSDDEQLEALVEVLYELYMESEVENG
jgi:hypothetical protein